MADKWMVALSLLFACPNAVGAVNICGQDLGVGSGVIRDASFSASSSATGREPHHARLNGNRAWCPGIVTGSYLQIDLGLPVNVWGIKTQGDPTNGHNYVRNYNVQFSFDGVNFAPLRVVESVNAKIFTGNNNNNGSVTVDFIADYFSGRHIRIIPTHFSGSPCLRVEVQGCTQYCPFALGIEDGSGPVLTASTSAAGSPPANAKLGTSSAWCASSINADHYLQIDLQQKMTITGIAMQGSPIAPNWIKTFRITLGVTSAASRLKIKGTDLFKGNVDQMSVVTNWFPPPITARFVKIGAVEFNNQICARIELFGCTSADCILPLGLESNVVTDSQMSASSELVVGIEAKHGRLNMLSRWCSLREEAAASSYLQIDLGFVATVTGILTQGDYFWKVDYIPIYQLSFDFDQSGSTMRCVRNKGNNNCKQFIGNTNYNGAVLNMFPDQAFSARVVRIQPLLRSGPTSCLRVELYGCKQGFGDSKGIQLGSQMDTRVSVTSSTGVVNPPRFQLNGGSAWCSCGMTGYVEVSFGGETIVSGIAIQGSPTSDSWVTKYRLSTRRMIGGVLSTVENNKEYLGSYSRDRAVVNWLASPLTTTAIRITVVTSRTAACLRIEMYGLDAACGKPLPETDDNHFTASASYSNDSRPSRGRLNSHPYSWLSCYDSNNCQRDTTANGWLQVCFSDFRTVSGVIIQGQGDQSYGAMRKFTIRYSYDGATMNDYKQNGIVKEFIGNGNRYEAVTRLFPKPVATKCIRVVATERFPTGGDTSARIRLLGCDPAIQPTVTLSDYVISLTKNSPVTTVDCHIIAQANATLQWKRASSAVVNDAVDSVTITTPADDSNVENEWKLTLQVNPANVGQQYENCIIEDAAQGLAICSSIYSFSASYTGAIAVTKTVNVSVAELSVRIGQPSNIITSNVTTTSGLITWDAPMQKGDFPIKDYIYDMSPGGRTGTVTSTVSLTRLLPYTTYTVFIKARNKFQHGVTAFTQFQTLPTAPLKPSMSVTISPDEATEEIQINFIGVDDFTGLVTGYEVILSTANLSCSEVTSAASATTTQFTSFTRQQIPYNAVIVKGIETVVGLDFVIPTPGTTWLCFRAFVKSGPTILYGAVESFRVERTFLKKPKSVKTKGSPTSSSFGIELAQGLATTSFYQVVVIQLLPGETKPLHVSSYYNDNSLSKFNATSHKAGIGYITGEFTATTFDEMKRFTVGDNRTYPLTNRTRRSTSSGVQFTNVALLPGTGYAVFQIAVSDLGSSQISPWSSAVVTAGIPTEDDAPGPGPGISVYVGISVALLAIVVVLVVVLIVCKRKRRNKDSSSKRVELNLQDYANTYVYANRENENQAGAASAGVYDDPDQLYVQPSVATKASHPVVAAENIPIADNMKHNHMRSFRKEYSGRSSFHRYENTSVNPGEDNNTYDDSIDNHCYEQLDRSTEQRHNTCIQATNVDVIGVIDDGARR